MHNSTKSGNNALEVMKMHKYNRLLLLIMLLALSVSCLGCTAGTNANAAVPEIPDDLQENEEGIPLIRLYDTANDRVEEIDIESYIMGVVAGEMRSDWLIEALKAQAILARTFTMKFLTTKDSRYNGADISTDIQEAQAYDALAVNDRIRQAVEETKGMVMVSDGDYPQAWFHAHSGGKTELPTKALEYSEDPTYLSVVDSPEPDDAPEEVQRWTAEFTLEEAAKACRATGIEIDQIESFTIGEKGESGRAVNFIVNGETVSAPSFRIQIGASVLKSTLIDSIVLSDGKIYFSGRGFGHGVGMSQWGAYGMAQDGEDYKSIITHYFSDIDFVRLWK